MDVLLVEDNADAGMALELLLQLEGHTVRRMRSVRDAVAAIAERPPAVLLCDLHLADGDGTAVARALPPGTPAVAVSGAARGDVWPACAEAGFTHYVEKPVDFDALASLLRSLPVR